MPSSLKGYHIMTHNGDVDSPDVNTMIWCRCAQTPASTIASPIRTTNGSETWRHIAMRYKPHPLARSMGQLQPIMQPTFGKHNFGESYTQWESVVLQYELETGKRLSDSVKTAM